MSKEDFNPINFDEMVKSLKELREIFSSKEDNENVEPKDVPIEKDPVKAASATENITTNTAAAKNNSKKVVGVSVTNSIIFDIAIGLVLLLMAANILLSICKIDSTNRSSLCWIVLLLTLVEVLFFILWVQFHKKESAIRKTQTMQEMEMEQIKFIEDAESEKIERQLKRKEAELRLDVEYKRQISKQEADRLDKEHIRNVENRMMDAVESYMNHLKEVACSTPQCRRKKWTR